MAGFFPRRKGEKDMKKYYDLGRVKMTIERTSSGFYQTETKDTETGQTIQHMFSTLEGALLEAISYTEIDEDDY